MSPELSKTVKRYLNLTKKLDAELKKEYMPIIKLAVEKKDEDTLKMLLFEIPLQHSFSMTIYQALVEIKHF
jgi:hypothetical protein